MSDLIDRQAAIDYCYALINAENPSDPSDEWNYSQERINQTEVILHHLEFMPSAQPEPQWIPCSERLPEEKKEVLISAENGLYIAELEIINGREYWSEIMEYRCIENVEAWMPLPEPWEGKSNERA